MAYDFGRLKTRIEEIEDWLTSEYQSLRTGQATPAVLDKITIDSYGAKSPIKNVANVGIEDVRTLRIVPWDASQVAEIEKAIQQADLGLSVVNDGKGIRAIFPELTGETREKIVKVAKQKLEDARISLRKEREETWEDIQKKEKDGEMNEDEKFRAKDEMQNLIDEANKNLDEIESKKEEEILN